MSASVELSSSRLRSVADRLDLAEPHETLAWAFEEFGDKAAIATGFGVDGMALVDMAVRINPSPNIFFIDTGFLFRETYDLKRRVEERYGIAIRAVRTGLTPEMQAQFYGSELWARNPDLCCELRKLEPLRVALNGLDAWITAIRRDQTETRSVARAVEWDERWSLTKVNPLVGWTRRDVWKYVLRNGVPYNPLHDKGYPSIGCTHCTRAVGSEEGERAGRWPGLGKTECGLHAPAQLVTLLSHAAVNGSVASGYDGRTVQGRSS